MRLEDLESLPQYYGLYFDPETGKTYRDDGTDTGFTFERARWTGPFGLHFSWPFLNPLAFATHETGEKILRFARNIAPKELTVALDETQKVTGPFTRTVERLITVTDGSTAENFSAGWIANSIIRTGEQRAADSLRTEWRYAGLKF